ncbi:MAG: NADH:ubiquinone reductase (Na(+)-transporting) subunit C [Thermodesulfobacteriota bacterium]
MQRQSNSYTLLFSFGVAFACALLLALASQALKPRQDLAQEADIKRNILQALGLMKAVGNDACDIRESSGEKCADIACCYRENVKVFIVDSSGAPAESNLKAEQIDLAREMDKAPAERRLPVFTRVKDGTVTAYCFPVYGKGLWSSIYGYVALERDLDTVLGITFHKQGETPGLGGEIQSLEFRRNFNGKKVFDAKGALVAVAVMKGKAATALPESLHQVDGITGATITGKGVTALLKKSLALYEPYILSEKKGGRHGVR